MAPTIIAQTSAYQGSDVGGRILVGVAFVCLVIVVLKGEDII